MAKHLTVVIPAHAAQDFIADCLASIKAQTRPPDSILIGIDECYKTHDAIDRIRHDYPNLTVYNYPYNAGTYVTLNSLIRHVPEYFVVFGADDMMHPNFCEEMLKNAPCISVASGVICMHKGTFQQLGGYRKWRVSADTDLTRRMKLAGIRYKVLPPLFMYRIHEGQITKSADRGHGSKIRETYWQIIRDNKQVYIEPTYHTNEQKL